MDAAQTTSKESKRIELLKEVFFGAQAIRDDMNAAVSPWTWTETIGGEGTIGVPKPLLRELFTAIEAAEASK